jgi:hypothetical protein
MIYSLSDIPVIFSLLNSIRDNDTFFSCPVKIEARSITSPASTLNLVRIADRFSAIFSASSRSLI